ncbi:MAG TPA: hypothetical protein VHL99_01490 [Candidatus Binatia bacterium]|nr:hypothetical protein [Candidatus Binatia bacterium]
MHQLTTLLHMIARWAVDFVTVPADVKRRAEDGLLTPADCDLIVQKLCTVGRSLATAEEAEKAARMAEETVRLIRLAGDEGMAEARLKQSHRLSGDSRKAYLRFLMSLSARNGTPH